MADEHLVYLTTRLTLDTSDLDKAKLKLRGVRDELSGAGRDSDAAGGKVRASALDLERLGQRLTIGVTLPIVAAGGAALKLGRDFDAVFTKMIGLAGVTADEIDGLKDRVLGLAGETGRSPQELAEGLYFARSAGLDAATAMDTLEAAAKGAAVGLGSTAQIVDTVTSALNAYGRENITAAQATDILTAGAREAKIEAADLAPQLGRLLPTAQQLGVGFDEVVGAMAFFSQTSGNASLSATQLDSVLRKLLIPSEQGKEVLAEMGLSAAQLQSIIQDRGLIGVIEVLREKFAGNSDALGRLFDDIQATQGAMLLLNDASGNLDRILAATKDSTGALGDAFRSTAESDSFKLQQAFAEMQSALIRAGEAILPIVAKIATGVANIAEAFSSLPGPAQNAILVLAGIAAVAGPILSVQRRISDLVSTVRNAGPALTRFSGALGTAGVVAAGAAVVYLNYAAAKQKSEAQTRSFAEALKAERDGQQGATDAAIRASLATTQWSKFVEETGLTIDELVRVIRGEAVPAFEEWADGQREGARASGLAYLAILKKNTEFERGVKIDEQAAEAERAAAERAEATARAVTLGARAREEHNTTVDASATTARRLKKAADAAARATEDLADAQERSARLAREQDAAWDELIGTLDEEEAWLNLQDRFDDVDEAADRAFKAAQRGAKDAAEQARDADLALIQLKKDVIEYGREVLGLPKDAVTAIAAKLDYLSLQAVERQLAILTRNRDINVEIIAKGGAGYGSGPRASGGPVFAGMAYQINEFGTEGFRDHRGNLFIPNFDAQVISAPATRAAVAAASSSARGTPTVQRTLNIESIVVQESRTPQLTAAAIARMLDERERALR